jgi:hypothetical protein
MTGDDYEDFVEEDVQPEGAGEPELLEGAGEPELSEGAEEGSGGEDELTEGDGPEEGQSDGGEEASLYAIEGSQAPLVDQHLENEFSSIESQYEQMAAQAAQLQKLADIQPENYHTEHEYNRAMSQAAAAQGQLQMLQTNGEALVQRMQQMKVQAWQGQVDKGRAEYRDFDQVISGQNFQPAAHIAEALARVPQGYKLAYNLAKSPARMRRLNNMSPMAAAMELGRELGRMGQTKGQRQSGRISKAPPPPRRLKGGGGGGGGEMSDAALEKKLGYR